MSPHSDLRLPKALGITVTEGLERKGFTNITFDLEYDFASGAYRFNMSATIHGHRIKTNRLLRNMGKDNFEEIKESITYFHERKKELEQR